jgi:hypothetical protein
MEGDNKKYNHIRGIIKIIDLVLPGLNILRIAEFRAKITIYGSIICGMIHRHLISIVV